MKSVIILSIALAGFLHGKPLTIPKSYFQTPEFAKAFVGSYGVLSAVEPKVDRDESALLAEVGDMFNQGNFKSAEQLVLAFINERNNPVDPEVAPKDVSPAMVFILGNLYFQSDRVEKAEGFYKLAIEHYPKFRRAHKNLALLYATRDDIESALPHLMKAVELGDSDHKSFGLLGFAYLKQEKPLAAEGAYRQAYLLSPDEKDWKLGLAQALLLQEKWKEAAAMLGELIDDNPQSADLWSQQANCYLGMEERLKAATNFEIMRLKGLAETSHLNLLGDIYMDQGSSLLALRAYLAAMEVSPKPDVARSIKTARILFDYGNPKGADEFVAKLRQRVGEKLTVAERVDLMLVEVDLAQAQEDWVREGELLARVGKLDPMNGEALVMYGQYFEKRSQEMDQEEESLRLRAKARSKFKLAMNSEDEQVQYLSNLRYGQMLVRGRDAVAGLPHLEKALGLKPSDSLKQYVRQVQRAAKRQQEREQRDADEAATNS